MIEERPEGEPEEPTPESPEAADPAPPAAPEQPAGDDEVAPAEAAASGSGGPEDEAEAVGAATEDDEEIARRIRQADPSTAEPAAAAAVPGDAAGGEDDEIDEAAEVDEAAEDEADADGDPDASPATPPAPARARRSRGGAAPGERVLVRAQAKYVRSSARKARLVCDLIRGKDVETARAVLAHSPRDVARAWTKVLDSAVANAENNHELDGDELRIFSVHADEGPTLKRFRPRAMGRATRIRKRTSHLTILLTPKE